MAIGRPEETPLLAGIPDVVEICSSAYAKTPAALTALLETLKSVGYVIKDLRTEENRNSMGRSVTVEEMEKNGWSTYYASLENIRFGKCSACDSLISTLGICVHGHQCEVCGNVTYLKVDDGSTIRFSFIDKDAERYSMADITMTVRRWDAEAGYVYFYADKVNGGLWLRDETKARAYLDSHADKWATVEEDGIQLIKMRYTQPWDPDVCVFNPSDIYGHKWGHKIVRVWAGKEYGEWGDFPVPDGLNIYEPFHWAPAQPSPLLHEQIIRAAGMVTDCGYYYQDGRAAFGAVHLERMRKFVEHFTTIDLKQYDAFIRTAPLSGPGMIRALAAFCHPDAVVENKPNIGNALLAVAKINDAFAGRGSLPMTDGELEAAADAFRDPEIANEVSQLFSRRVVETEVPAWPQRKRMKKIRLLKKWVKRFGYRLKFS